MKDMNSKIDVQINYKDRPSELAMLLCSLEKQTYNDFDVYVMDDASGTQLENYYFIDRISRRLRSKGHRVIMFRNEPSRGVSEARQKLVDYIIAHGRGGFICRIDDDVVLEPDYFEKLMEVIDDGYDLASGVTPPFEGGSIARDVKHVSPVINRVVLDENGGFLVNCDDCGYEYLQKDVILPCDHFRSSALYKKSVHDKVNYEVVLTPCGFREEQFFSFRMILAGFKLGVHTGAVNWHLRCPSGGDRRSEYQSMSLQNQRLINKMTKRWFKEHGDFIEDYHKELGVKETQEQRLASLNKNNNLIYTREE